MQLTKAAAQHPVAGKVAALRALVGHVQDLLDVRGIQIELQFFGGGADQSALQSQGLSHQGFKVDRVRLGLRRSGAASIANRLAGQKNEGQKLPRFGGPIGFFRARDLGHAGQVGGDLRVVVLCQERQQLVADAVAEVMQLQVRLIVTPCLSERSQVRFHLRAPDSEQRAHDAAVRLEGIDPRQPAGAGSAQKPQQDRLRLVVQRVGGGDPGDEFFRDASGKKLVAQVAGGGFEAERTCFGLRGRITGTGMELKTVTDGELLHEGLVVIGLTGADAVMKMQDAQHDAEFLAQFQHHPQQGDGIGAAGDGQTEPVAGLKQVVFTDKVVDALAHGTMLPAMRRMRPEARVYTIAAMKVIAIIPAAGMGTRMAQAANPHKVSKQFFELAGTPILLHTLRRFAAVPQVAEIFVALRGNEMLPFGERLKSEPYAASVRLVEGGENRQGSVYNALRTVEAADDDIVLVHDAVRPFIETQTIHNVILAAQKHGAAIAGLPAVDTVKQVERMADGAIITSTIPRERVVMAQTPQGFRYGTLRQAFDDAAVAGFVGTDEASLVERIGKQVAVVMGSPRNIKITTPGDMELAEVYIKQI